MLEGPLQHAPGEGAIELFISDVQHRNCQARDIEPRFIAAHNVQLLKPSPANLEKNPKNENDATLQKPLKFLKGVQLMPMMALQMQQIRHQVRMVHLAQQQQLELIQAIQKFLELL